MTKPAGSGHIDLAFLDQLLPAAGGDLGLLTFVIDAYRERAPRLLTGLQEAAAHGDHSAAAQFAHDLASTSGQVGALGITDVARTIEQLAEEGASDLLEHCRRIDGLLPEVLAGLEEARLVYESSNR
jgi:HPt (histidine-containing phosphotransfer) domain-containing protein